MARASCLVPGSPTVGPEAITAGIIARDVRDGEGDDLGRPGGRGKPAALDGGEMLADTVHLADGRTGPQQRFVDGPLVLERETRRRRCEQRRPASGDEGQYAVPPPKPADEVQNAPGRVDAGLVRYRMGRFHRFNVPGIRAVAIGRDDDSLERSPTTGTPTKAAMAEAALPAPTTIVRPATGGGRAPSMHRSARAAPTAAWKSDTRNDRGSSIMRCLVARSPLVRQLTVDQAAERAEVETAGGDDGLGGPCRQPGKKGSAEKSRNGWDPHGLWFRKRPGMQVTMACSALPGPLIAFAD